jgi:hypothetical protein
MTQRPVRRHLEDSTALLLVVVLSPLSALVVVVIEPLDNSVLLRVGWENGTRGRQAISGGKEPIEKE